MISGLCACAVLDRHCLNTYESLPHAGDVPGMVYSNVFSAFWRSHIRKWWCDWGKAVSLNRHSAILETIKDPISTNFVGHLACCMSQAAVGAGCRKTYRKNAHATETERQFWCREGRFGKRTLRFENWTFTRTLRRACSRDRCLPILIIISLENPNNIMGGCTAVGFIKTRFFFIYFSCFDGLMLYCD